ncbi:MARVEL domain-containing protein 3-like [Pelodytes ibericus]
MPQSERNMQSDRLPPPERSNHDRPRREHQGHRGSSNRDREGYRDRPHRERDNGRSHPSNGRVSSRGSKHNQQSRHSSHSSHRASKENQSYSNKCSRLCSRRGILQFVEILCGILVLICVIASYAVLTGYTSAAGFNTFSIDSAYSPFQGTELQQVRDMDMQYIQLRAPGVYGGVAFSLLLCALTVLFLILGAKPLPQVSIRVLFAEMIFDAVAVVAYIVAVGLYLYFIKQVNSTDICKKRAQLYAGRGYTWMNCDVQGGDAAVALFSVIAACLYIPSAIFCGLYIRTVRQFRKNHMHYEYEHNIPPEDVEVPPYPSTLV